ncbi:hypothetical protein B0I37DRAFT_368799 [Chaetomium sp. MPI-CAGE-AT-0009]|nr:hypothetical protein B0I37DRAFT_368799 [Chaetomium sp. MPI-CAGE-AT-0009]
MSTSSIPPIQASRIGSGLRPGQIAGIVLGSLGMAFLLLAIASVLFVFRSRRRRANKDLGFEGLLNHTPTTPPPATYNKPEIENPVDEPQISNNNTNTTTSKQQHHPLPPSETDDSSSVLSIPTTFVTRHTNSTFLPTTALRHPRYLAPLPQSAQTQRQGNLSQPPASPRPSGRSTRRQSSRRSGGGVRVSSQRVGEHPPPTPTSPASLLQPGLPIPSEARLSGVGGGEDDGYVKVQVRRPP